jgi:hypothetical protein
MNIKIKRVYERPDKEDGTRILVDRLWPRGLTKAKASVDLWLKDIAPSTELGVRQSLEQKVGLSRADPVVRERRDEGQRSAQPAPGECAICAR